MVIHDKVVGAGRDGARKCAANAVPAQPVGHFLGRGKVVYGGNGYSRIAGRRDYPCETATDPPESVDADRDTHGWLSSAADDAAGATPVQ
ncbi:hypothetical protein BKA14_004653 [Actinoplanes abujensis]|uniref:Uncharacterized protein n=1 Tax=Paractinoplanes abujensis TaxID=882441 RepID=A0A7W7CW05_9ACTN|nr:hypothetical protein [Actinoplanes abujensis]